MPVTITIRKGQNAVDLAIQHYGSLEGLFDVAGLNGVGIHDTPAPGPGIVTGIYNNTTTFLKKVIVATSVDGDGPAGIGYWTIGRDFIVS